ncbi:MAG: sugar transferase [Candidatus Eisenbacteria bacterium]|nr:sugar transferase [Candidatus Eisenbacteria bacterium]
MLLFTGDLLVAGAAIPFAVHLAPLLGAADRFGAIPAAAIPFIYAALVPLLALIAGLYKEGIWASRRRQALPGLKTLLWAVGISTGALFLFAREIPWNLRYAVLVSHGVLTGWLLLLRPILAKRMHRGLARNPLLRERVLVFGADAIGREVARNLAASSPCVEILGFAAPQRPRGTGSAKLPFHVCDLSDLPALSRELGADLVVIARPDLPREEVVLLSDRLSEAGVRTQVVSNVFNQLVDSVPFETLEGVPLLAVGQTPLRGRHVRGKRIFDIVATSLGGLVILPFMLLIALLVKLSSPGPVLYRQTRVGKNGQPFDFFKFRSMRLAPDDPVHRDYARGLVQNGGAAATDQNGKKVYKLVDDSRITSIGRFLRRTSLDELPQLINVLRGEMSLVGPRPCLSFEYEVYRDWQKRRLDVTPGMTGLWQVTGRSYVTFEDMVLLDLFYIGNWTFGMDLRILLKTIPVVVFGKGGM